jgi:hypothetical protein
MLSGKESLEDLKELLEQAIKDDDWFLVGRLEVRIDNLKKILNHS